MSIVSLIGMPGSGKSTVGRLLARRLDLSFLDSDNVIEDEVGCPIREFFAREGEERFRDVEQRTLAALCMRGPLVLATGGGSVLRSANRDALRNAGPVIYLHSPPNEVYRRVRHDTRRPLLQVADPLARLHELYEERDPLYRATAHFVIETGRPTVAALVNRVLMQLELAGKLPARP